MKSLNSIKAFVLLSVAVTACVALVIPKVSVSTILPDVKKALLDDDTIPNIKKNDSMLSKRCYEDCNCGLDCEPCAQNFFCCSDSDCPIGFDLSKKTPTEVATHALEPPKNQQMIVGIVSPERQAAVISPISTEIPSTTVEIVPEAVYKHSLGKRDTDETRPMKRSEDCIADCCCGPCGFCCRVLCCGESNKLINTPGQAALRVMQAPETQKITMGIVDQNSEQGVNKSINGQSSSNALSTEAHEVCKKAKPVVMP